MKIEITKKTMDILKIFCLNPQDPNSDWNIMTMRGYYRIDISDDVADEIIARGGALDSPESIEKIIVDTVKSNNN